MALPSKATSSGATPDVGLARMPATGAWSSAMATSTVASPVVPSESVTVSLTT